MRNWGSSLQVLQAVQLGPHRTPTAPKVRKWRETPRLESEHWSSASCLEQYLVAAGVALLSCPPQRGAHPQPAQPQADRTAGARPALDIPLAGLRGEDKGAISAWEHHPRETGRERTSQSPSEGCWERYPGLSPPGHPGPCRATPAPVEAGSSGLSRAAEPDLSTP